MNKKIYFTGVLVVVLMMSFVVVSAGSFFTKEAKAQFKAEGKKLDKMDSKEMCKLNKLKKKDKQNKKCDQIDTDIPEGFGMVEINETLSPTNKPLIYIYND